MNHYFPTGKSIRLERAQTKRFPSLYKPAGLFQKGALILPLDVFIYLDYLQSTLLTGTQDSRPKCSQVTARHSLEHKSWSGKLVLNIFVLAFERTHRYEIPYCVTPSQPKLKQSSRLLHIVIIKKPGQEMYSLYNDGSCNTRNNNIKTYQLDCTEMRIA